MSSTFVAVTTILQVSLRKSAAPIQGDAPCTSQRKNPSRPGSRVSGHNTQRRATLPALLASGATMVAAFRPMRTPKPIGALQIHLPNLANIPQQCAVYPGQ